MNKILDHLTVTNASPLPPDTEINEKFLEFIELEELKNFFWWIHATDIKRIYKHFGLEDAKKELFSARNVKIIKGRPEKHKLRWQISMVKRTDVFKQLEVKRKKKLLCRCGKQTCIENECTICYENYCDKYFGKCNKGHEFCNDCIRKNGEVILSQSGFVKCMNINCEEILSLDLFEEPLKSKLSRKQLISAINSMKDVETCQVCDYAELVDPPTEENKVFICENCNRAHCRLCKIEWVEKHMDKSCLQAKENVKEHLLAEEKITKTITRECPNCKTLLIKSGGCNRILCSCGTNICYVCRNEIAAGYQHFCNCPINQCVCNKCKVNADTFTTDLAEIDEIKMNRNIGVDKSILLRDAPL